MISLLLFLLVAFVIVTIFARRGIRKASEAVVVFSVMLALLWVGPLLLDDMTNGRATPSETVPWFLAIVLALGTLWVWVKKPFRRASGDGATPLDNRAAPSTNENLGTKSPPPVSGSSPSGPGAPQSSVQNHAREEQHRQTIFVCYRRLDSADVTGRMYDRLAEEFGSSSVYKDVDTVPLGVDFREYLDKLVGECDVLLAVIGRHWLDAELEGKNRLEDIRDLVRIEIESALARGIPVIPVLVGGAAAPQDADLPEALKPLAYRNGTHVRPDPDFHSDLNRLITGLKQHFQQS